MIGTKRTHREAQDNIYGEDPQNAREEEENSQAQLTPDPSNLIGANKRGAQASVTGSSAAANPNKRIKLNQPVAQTAGSGKQQTANTSGNQAKQTKGGSGGNIQGSSKVTLNTGSQLTKKQLDEFNRANPSGSKSANTANIVENNRFEVLSEDGKEAVQNLMNILIRTYRSASTISSQENNNTVSVSNASNNKKGIAASGVQQAANSQKLILGKQGPNQNIPGVSQSGQGQVPLMSGVGVAQGTENAQSAGFVKQKGAKKTTLYNNKEDQNQLNGSNPQARIEESVDHSLGVGTTGTQGGAANMSRNPTHQEIYSRLQSLSQQQIAPNSQNDQANQSAMLRMLEEQRAHENASKDFEQQRMILEYLSHPDVQSNPQEILNLIQQLGATDPNLLNGSAIMELLVKHHLTPEQYALLQAQQMNPYQAAGLYAIQPGMNPYHQGATPQKSMFQIPKYSHVTIAYMIKEKQEQANQQEVRMKQQQEQEQVNQQLQQQQAPQQVVNQQVPQQQPGPQTQENIQHQNPNQGASQNTGPQQQNLYSDMQQVVPIQAQLNALNPEEAILAQYIMQGGNPAAAAQFRYQQPGLTPEEQHQVLENQVRDQLILQQLSQFLSQIPPEQQLLQIEQHIAQNPELQPYFIRLLTAPTSQAAVVQDQALLQLQAQQHLFSQDPQVAAALMSQMNADQMRQYELIALQQQQMAAQHLQSMIPGFDQLPPQQQQMLHQQMLQQLQQQQALGAVGGMQVQHMHEAALIAAQNQGGK